MRSPKSPRGRAASIATSSRYGSTGAICATLSARHAGGSVTPNDAAILPADTLALTVAQLAPVLPYLLLVAMLAARPRGLFGERTRDA